MQKRAQTLTVQAENLLRSCLSHGCYPPGRRLGLVQLSADLGVSQTVVQKITGPLIEAGLLEKEQTSGSVTSPHRTAPG
ncbi:hypothetical protein [Streptomyces sp. NPDC007083]|uniref:hypothetical protein n=1 Tax=Streptomyces sp. NPDC007083 TaxID=3156913 RepID=UPI0033D43DA6